MAEAVDVVRKLERDVAADALLKRDASRSRLLTSACRRKAAQLGLNFIGIEMDEAVGSLLIEEGGGCVTDLAGRRLDFSVGRRLSRNVGLVATNGVLHAALLKGIQHAQAHALPPRA